MADKSPFVVSPDWLEQHLHDPGLSIVDASWYLPDQKRDARAEYDAAHIPGAVFFDQDAVVDPESGLPHTLPSPTEFERHVSAMGITRDDTIIVYDGPGMFTAPRVWWMFRVMGASNVFVLDGGFDNWKADDRPVTNAPTKIAAPPSFRSSTPAAWSISTRWATSLPGDRRRSPMRAGPDGSPAPSPNRARACARATCRARAMCITPRCRRTAI